LLGAEYADSKSCLLLRPLLVGKDTRDVGHTQQIDSLAGDMCSKLQVFVDYSFEVVIICNITVVVQN